MKYPPIPLRERAQRLVIGVDVGGTKIAAALVDAQGTLHGRVQQPTDVCSPTATLDSIAATIDQAISKAGCDRAEVAGVGLGIPGKVDPERGMGVLSVNLSWQDVPVKAALEAALGLPCFVENDVKAAALGESRYGSGRGLRNLIYLIIGTGIAAGIVIDGKLYRGSTGMAGEIGHAIVDRHGALCKCGSRGCFEAQVAGPGIAARAAEAFSRAEAAAPGRPVEDSRTAVTAELVFQMAAREDPIAQEVLKETAADIGFALRWLATAFDPELIVLAGGAARASGLLDAIHRELKRQAEESSVFGELYKPELVQLSKLGTDAGILGAAALVP